MVGREGVEKHRGTAADNPDDGCVGDDEGDDQGEGEEVGLAWWVEGKGCSELDRH